MRRVLVLLGLGLLTVSLCGCGGGSKVSKNQFGAPKLGVPDGSGAGSTFTVPENLIPPGAQPTKTESGVSDRIYATEQRANAVQGFFAEAIKGANIETTRSGEHVTIIGGGWTIEVFGGGEEGTTTTIVYAKTAEVK